MQLNFPWTGIETLLEEIRSAKTVKPMYKRKTGKGFWLVGDQGVYLMANTSDGPMYKTARMTNATSSFTQKNAIQTKFQNGATLNGRHLAAMTEQNSSALKTSKN